MITKITSLSIYDAEEKEPLRDCTPELQAEPDKAQQVAGAIHQLIETFQLMPQIQKELELEHLVKFQVKYRITPTSLEASSIDGVKKISIAATELIKNQNISIINLVRSLFPKVILPAPAPTTVAPMPLCDHQSNLQKEFPMTSIPEEDEAEEEDDQSIGGLMSPISDDGGFFFEPDNDCTLCPPLELEPDEVPDEDTPPKVRLQPPPFSSYQIGHGILPAPQGRRLPGRIPPCIRRTAFPRFATIEDLSLPPLAAQCTALTTTVKPEIFQEEHLYDLLRRASRLPTGVLPSSLNTATRRLIANYPNRQALEEALTENTDSDLSHVLESTQLERVFNALHERPNFLALEDPPASPTSYDLPSLEVTVEYTEGAPPPSLQEVAIPRGLGHLGGWNPRRFTHPFMIREPYLWQAPSWLTELARRRKNEARLPLLYTAPRPHRLPPAPPLFSRWMPTRNVPKVMRRFLGGTLASAAIALWNNK